MKRGKRRQVLLAVLLCVLFLGGLFGTTVFAAGARVYFGSDTYTWDLGERSPIGFYLSSEDGSDLNSVNIRVEYDPEVLRFDSADNTGITVLSEGEFQIRRSEGWGEEFKQILYFTPLVSEMAEIRVASGFGDTDARRVGMDGEVTAQIEIPMPEGCELTSLSVDGEPVEDFSPEQQRYELRVPWDTERVAITAEGEEGVAVTIRGGELDAGENFAYVTTENEEGQKARYTLCITREEPTESAALPGEGANIPGQIDTDVEAGNEAASAGEEKNPLETELEEQAPHNQKPDRAGRWPFNRELPGIVKILAVILALMILAEVVTLLVYFIKKKRTRKKRRRQTAINLLKIEYPKGEPEVKPVVIKAEQVCMDFSRAVNEYSSVKELVIRAVKGQSNKGIYRALNDISFEIRKGEVVGIVGTNGAGKSTLLKIVSGALRPTSGKMLVNKQKVQILTLGTGFDMELTGRENVYLNGAIIGYEKSFIDEHYEQIVEFAELEGFMGEKVKNYSSGMVSRLGFAIATAGDAAEILILDEVLSVGDRLFQKKSLQRVKEMIHGGSTVIMVSHSTKTIRDNCSKAIWIEKGHLIAQGEARQVCDLYEKYDGNLEKQMGAQMGEMEIECVE